MPTVQNAVATKVRVSLGTSLFLGVATAVTFSIGGAMLAGLAPTPLSMTICYKDTTSQTLYKDAAMTTVATSDCGIIRPVTDKPLAITDVVSVMNIATLQFGQTYEFRSGTNTFGTWQRYTFVDGSTSATPLPLSIAGTLAPDGTPIPANVLFIETNLGKLNVCLPEMAAQKTVYVGMSGTVYNDAALTQRSTLHTCATILARAATPSNITAGSRLMNGGSIYLGRESMMYSGLGSFSDYRFDPSYTQPLAGSKAPLRLTHTPGWGAYPPHTYPYTVPADILTLTTDIGTLNLCFPSQTYANENDGNVLFAGTDGSLYTDALLTKRATTQTCESTLVRAYTPTQVTGASVQEPEFTYWGIDFSRGQYEKLGYLYGYGSYLPYYAPLDMHPRSPLMLQYAGNGNHEQADLPAHTVAVTTNLGTKDICSPIMHVGQDENGYPKNPDPLFVDKNGSTFYDAHLLKSAKACPTVIDREIVIE